MPPHSLAHLTEQLTLLTVRVRLVAVVTQERRSALDEVRVSRHYASELETRATKQKKLSALRLAEGTARYAVTLCRHPCSLLCPWPFSRGLLP